MARIGSRRLARLLAAVATTLPGLVLLPAGAARAACPATAPFDQPIAAAAARFALPAPLLRAVVAAESDFAVFAVSPRGAMGLMQIMPDTWADLRLRHALGRDPFDPCDNILAGAAYLREMLDRYGDPGFLAAYNAGPGRYEAYLRGARPLPLETLAYVDKIAARMGRDGALAARSLPDRDAWRRGDLFVAASKSGMEPDPESAPPIPSVAPEPVGARPAEAARDTLFVDRTGVPK